MCDFGASLRRHITSILAQIHTYITFGIRSQPCRRRCGAQYLVPEFKLLAFISVGESSLHHTNGGGQAVSRVTRSVEANHLNSYISWIGSNSLTSLHIYALQMDHGKRTADEAGVAHDNEGGSRQRFTGISIFIYA